MKRKGVSEIVLGTFLVSMALIAIFMGASVSQEDYFWERFREETVDITADRIPATVYAIEPHTGAQVEIDLGAGHYIREVNESNQGEFIDRVEGGQIYGEGIYVEYGEAFSVAQIQTHGDDLNDIILEDADQDEGFFTRHVCIENEGTETVISEGPC